VVCAEENERDDVRGAGAGDPHDTAGAVNAFMLIALKANGRFDVQAADIWVNSCSPCGDFSWWSC
jgi:hypothetical protein